MFALEINELLTFGL